MRINDGTKQVLRKQTITTEKMREVKFRVWDEEYKRYITGEDWSISVLNGNVRGKYGEEFTGFEIQQYTGLKGKNGKEIYEGDVMKRIYTYEVRFDKGRFYLHHKSGHHVKNGFDIDFEVIGNIHEQPELI